MKRSGFKFWKKLKTLKGNIKSWVQGNGSDIGGKILKLELNINNLEKKLESSPNCVERRKLLMSWRVELWKLFRHEEQTWHQKSRIKWLKEGDRNTKFFHMSASNRARVNFMGKLVVRDRTLTHPSDIKKAVFDHFHKQFSVKNVCPWREFNCNFHTLDVSQVSMLESLIVEDKVWKAICSCDGDKTPRPDDFNLNFFKSN